MELAPAMLLAVVLLPLWVPIRHMLHDFSVCKVGTSPGLQALSELMNTLESTSSRENTEEVLSSASCQGTTHLWSRTRATQNADRG